VKAQARLRDRGQEERQGRDGDVLSLAVDVVAEEDEIAVLRRARRGAVEEFGTDRIVEQAAPDRRRQELLDMTGHGNDPVREACGQREPHPPCPPEDGRVDPHPGDDPAAIPQQAEERTLHEVEIVHKENLGPAPCQEAVQADGCEHEHR
jgi:hypothetical protein